MKRKRYWLFFVLILVLAAALRLIFAAGFVYDDTFPYGAQAAHIADGTYNMNADVYYSMRIAFTSILGLFVSLFGKNAVGFYGWPFTAGILTVALGMKMAKDYFGEKVSLITGILLAVTPIFVFWSTIPHPDALNPFLWNLFLYFFIRGELAETHPKTARNFALSGVILGFSFYNRIFSILLLVVVPISILIFRRFSLKAILRYAWIVPGFGLAFLIGNGAYYIWGGDFFLRYHNTLIKESWIPNRSGDVWYWEEIPATWDWFKTFPFRYGVGFFLPTKFRDWSWLFYGTILGLIYTIRKPLENRNVIWLWFAAIYIAMDVVLNTVTSLLDWHPYIMAVVVPAAILFAIWIDKIVIPSTWLDKLKNNSRIWLSLFGVVIIAAGLVNYIILAEKFPSFILAIMNPYRKAWLAFVGISVGGTSVLAILFVLLFVFTHSQIQQKVTPQIQTSLVIAFAISSIILTATQKPILTEHTVESSQTIRDAIETQQCKNVYYQSYKTSIRLIPQYWFRTTYTYKMPYESWDVEYHDSLIHFEFMPANLETIKPNDCILLYEPDYISFIEHSLSSPPYFAPYYQYPEYLKILPENWTLVIHDHAHMLYQVQAQ